MDSDLLYTFRFLAECRLFLERQFFKSRHKLLCSSQMANRDKLDEGEKYPPSAFEEPSSDKEEHSVRFDTDVQIVEGADPAPEKLLNGPENRPKKSLFEITSVVNSENDNRGEGVGNEVEDAELDDTLSDTLEVTSPTVITDRKLSNFPNGSEAPSAQINTSATSRFKIVKIPRTARTEPHKRGRWTCQEAMEPPPENKLERSQSDNRIPHGNHTTSSRTSFLRETDSYASDNRSTERPNQGLQSRTQTEQFLNSSNRDSVRYTSDADGRLKINEDGELSKRNRNEDWPVAGASSVDETNYSAKAAEPRQREGNGDERKLPVSMVPPLTFEDALTQIQTIHSTLVTVVETLNQVETLKETMSSWTDENRMLKEENERLKKLLENDASHPDPDSVSSSR